MKLSTSSDSAKYDWDAIRDPQHAEDVWAVVSRNFDRYFSSWPLLTQDDQMASQLAAKFRRTTASSTNAQRVNSDEIAAWIATYDKSAAKYRDCFDSEAMVDYEDDPSAFKGVLSKRCEIIQRILNSKNTDLKEWIIRFKMATSQDLLDVFRSLLSAREEYEETFGDDASTYADCDSAEALVLEAFGEDESVKMPGVIGMGIRSIVLHFLNARLFAQQNRAALYALYFLSERATFGLPSRTSPFLMIDDVNQRHGDDRNFKMEYNYWYPYPIGTLFAIRVYREIEARCRELGEELDPTYRYLYVARFYDHVCAQHREEMKVMRGGDDLSWG
jgi:hypothetical protein